VPIANARFHLGEEDEKNIKTLVFSAIAKYPFVSVDHAKIEFGDVLVGMTVEQKYILRNTSPVPVKF